MRKSIVLIVACLMCPIAWTQSISVVHFHVDNDFFAARFGRGVMDFDYTSGLELEVEFDSAPSILSWPVVAKEDEAVLSLSFGQQIYTPRSRGEREVPGERPFAGWIYVAASVKSETSGAIRAGRLAVGATGPPALAEQTQNGLHSVFGSFLVNGWENQLPFEPGFAAQYDYSRRVYLANKDNLRVEVRPRVGLGLGTIWSGSSTGADLLARTGNLTVFGGVRGEWVWRNEFLDGTAFRESERTPKIPIVGQYDFGASYRLGRFGATARFVTRSREYDGQPNSHQFGSLTASVNF